MPITQALSLSKKSRHFWMELMRPLMKSKKSLNKLIKMVMETSAKDSLSLFFSRKID
jgi:hypothetical protein